MNNLALNGELRSKLVRMTSFIMYEYDVGMNGDILWYQHKTEETKCGKVHWLEQVMYHLAEKILDRDDLSRMMFLTTCCLSIPVNESTHPINYLYTRYIRNKEAAEKQLKLNLKVDERNGNY